MGRLQAEWSGSRRHLFRPRFTGKRVFSMKPKPSSIGSAISMVNGRTECPLTTTSIDRVTVRDSLSIDTDVCNDDAE